MFWFRCEGMHIHGITYLIMIIVWWLTAWCVKLSRRHEIDCQNATAGGMFIGLVGFYC